MGESTSLAHGPITDWPARFAATIVVLAWLTLTGAEAIAADEPVFAVDVSSWSGYLSASEVDCWRESGVEHVISGTQIADITQQQLGMAVFAGMSVDAYAVLYWDFGITNQVKTALSMIQDFPVQRLWLDVEVPPGSWSASQIVDKIAEAVSACGTMPCGIYTRKVWWRDNVADSTAFSHLPIWYAYYDGRQGFDDWYAPMFWYEGPFGGWSDPTGKQYDSDWTAPDLCGVNVDYNLMQLDSAAPGDPPPAPTGLSPDGGVVIDTSPVVLSASAIPDTIGYEFEIQYQDGEIWQPYYTYTSDDNAQTFWPFYNDTAYRWRMRAENTAGWSEWSDWASFDFGDVVRATPPPAPTDLSPDGGERITTSSVTLRADTVADATGYEFEIGYQVDDTWLYYYTYAVATNAQTFWPVYDDTAYRWRVRAQNAQGWSPWSAWASFDFGNVVRAVPPPAPTGLSPDGDERITTNPVTLRADIIADATGYEFEIWYADGATWRYYFTYSPVANAQTFWPVRDAVYRWRVRAQNQHGSGAWSGWATFTLARS